MTASALTVPERALQGVRVGYGMVLVLTPGLVLRLVTGRIPSPRACRVARVLGTRHLIQAAATAAAPRPEVFAIGGEVDAVHAASMLLASVWPGARRAALADALVEAALAAGGYSATAR
ncbi:MAG TPA: hypothetical protein VMA97_11635 [Streptosporangiaceae bacterium]|nr:hypothetical protein [Streptosporangiaceae bacterium]